MVIRNFIFAIFHKLLYILLFRIKNKKIARYSNDLQNFIDELTDSKVKFENNELNSDYVSPTRQ